MLAGEITYTYLFLEFNPALGISILESDFRTPILVAVGAIPGALSRYYITIFVTEWLGTTFPYGTFLINLTGSLLIGFLSTLVTEQVINTNFQALLIIGFLGAYTTFSTYALDTFNFLRTGSRKRALLYWSGSPILGFVCVEVGILIARNLL